MITNFFQLIFSIDFKNIIWIFLMIIFYPWKHWLLLNNGLGKELDWMCYIYCVVILVHRIPIPRGPNTLYTCAGWSKHNVREVSWCSSDYVLHCLELGGVGGDQSRTRYRTVIWPFNRELLFFVLLNIFTIRH